MRGHLQCRDTLAGNEGCPLKTGTTVPSLAPATAIGPAMFSAHCKTRVTVDQIIIFPDSAVFINPGAV